jgi:hypothetical protein
LRREETIQRASGALDVLETTRASSPSLDQALDGITHSAVCHGHDAARLSARPP